jgi:pyruvate ferredoxin oxidoreductase alpha subunit
MNVRKAMDGNQSVAEGARLARIQLVAAYPITPQTPIVEHISEYVRVGQLQAKYIAVESEHSALSAVIGGALVGARAFTATAGAGLALMHEIVGVAAGCRLPIVMAIANRALPSPWSLQCDHSDSMSERDQGWIQLYAESCQEALDLVILAYRLAEDKRVRIPVMLCEDGFFVSHTTEVVEMLTQQDVDAFLPPLQKQNLYLDVDDPLVVNQLNSSDVFTETKYEHYRALEGSQQVFSEICGEFRQKFGRSYDVVSAYETEDAETVVVAMGSIAGTVHEVVKNLRAAGEKVGLAKVTCYRPFPREAVRRCLAKAKQVIVIDRSAGMGSEGPLAIEVKASLYGMAPAPRFYSFVGGLGGRDFHYQSVMNTLDRSRQFAGQGVPQASGVWIDVKECAQ